MGAGIGGLTCAIELARRGTAVTVVEKAQRPGGKMREIGPVTSPIDSGPTVFTMRWVFDEIFEAAGSRLADHLSLEPMNILARHAWADGSRLELYTDIERSAEAIDAFAGPGAASGYRAFCRESAAIFETLRTAYLTAQQTGPIGLARAVGLDRLGALMGIRPFETLWGALGAHFQDPRLRQLFGRYATYCGSSPFAAPATLMLIAHVEREGVWSIVGGMQRLAEALQGLAASVGVRFQFGSRVEEIRVAGGRASGVTLSDGGTLDALCVVVNADAAALTKGLFGGGSARATPKRPDSARSLSAITWSLKVRTGGFPMVRHNVFFSRDYAAEFDDIFRMGRLPQNPTIYICAQDRSDGGLTGGAVDDVERLLVLMNAPANGDGYGLSEEERAACERRVINHLEQCGLTVASLEQGVITTPQTFEALFPGTGGALYGPATHGWDAAFRRPGARTRLPGLYLAGGGAHPGAGVPMAAISGRLAAARLIQDLASMRRFHPGATPGGISTPSATTVATV